MKNECEGKCVVAGARTLWPSWVAEYPYINTTYFLHVTLLALESVS